VEDDDRAEREIPWTILVGAGLGIDGGDAAMWHRDRFPAGTELIGEAEAVLAGRYAEHLESGQRPVPAWAWVNLLAHGTEEGLREARARLGEPGASQRWRDARGYLAGEILGVVEVGGIPLDELQREVLVPFELRLAGRDRSRPLTPSDVVNAVTAILEAHRRLRRHR
jgi:hypothetical protein